MAVRRYPCGCDEKNAHARAFDLNVCSWGASSAWGRVSYEYRAGALRSRDSNVSRPGAFISPRAVNSPTRAMLTALQRPFGFRRVNRRVQLRASTLLLTP